MSTYTIDKLKDIFLDHAKQADIQREHMIKNYKEEYPDLTLPDHLKDEFNIAYALHLICTEIVKLNDIIAAKPQ